MSEYQYYEFLAVDRPLTDREMGELRDISTRAHITPTSFVNTYNWGDLKARPMALMEKYFDAFVYVANWGTREFMMRVPKRFMEPTTLAAYKTGDALSFESKGEFIIVTFMARDEEPRDDWESGEGRLSSLVPLRADLLAGDTRCLYLGWLRGAQQGEVTETALEPPVPVGLGILSGPLKGLADFLCIDCDLIDMAARASVAPSSEFPEEGELTRWIDALPLSEKNALLLQLAKGERHIRTDLLQRFRGAHIKEETIPNCKQRTAADLLAAAEERRAVRRRETAEREAQEQARRRHHPRRGRAGESQGWNLPIHLLADGEIR